mmetsp:Transcript_9378/g.12938  ORF Transcript_9378/g.12938 Transcript_9378/m.12938 type:complete len:313 (+) Transcript_9378:185-1123(+)
MEPNGFEGIDPKLVVFVQSCFRRWKVRTQFAKLVRVYTACPESRPFRQRNDVWRELLQTEKHYIQSIVYIIQSIKLPMEEAAKGNKPIMSLSDISKLFGNIEQIKDLHLEIFSRLEQSAREWPVWNTFGKTFLEKAPMLLLYSEYVVNFAEALKVLKKHEGEKRLTKFKQRVLEDPQNAALTIEAYLIMPIQRIPRYELLFRELVKLTPPEHVDYPNLNKCLSVIKDVCTKINENKRNAEGVEEEINKQVKSMKTLKKVLIKRTGTIRKISSSVAKQVKKLPMNNTDSAKESDNNNQDDWERLSITEDTDEE